MKAAAPKTNSAARAKGRTNAGGARESAPPRPVVVKIGGRACETPRALQELAAEVAAFPGPLLLVHGGGADVSAWCERLGLVPRFERGLRVTDAATLEVAAAVLAGLANKRWVATLRAADVDAVGLAALDGGVCDVVPHPEAGTLGEVGAVAAVHPALLAALLGQGRVPVLASIGAHQGRLLNLNADDLAAALAAALGARLLVLLSDTPGVKLNGAITPRLGRAELDRALAHPDVKDGMVAKLAAARVALDGGAERAVIAAWNGPGTIHSLVAGTGRGTVLTAAAATNERTTEEAIHG